MSDPRRLRDSGTDIERDLLRQVADVSSPAGEKERVRMALRARIARGSGGGPGGSPSPGSRRTRGRVLLGAGAGAALVLAIGYTLSIGGDEPRTRSAVRPAELAPSETAPLAVRSPEPTASVQSAAVAPAAPTSMTSSQPKPSAVVATSAPIASTASATPSVVDTSTVNAAAPSASAATLMQSRLREESELIARARTEVRAGYFAAALGTLDDTRTKFPNGVLAQEREALTIEALFKLGKRDEASRRFADFSRDNPGSPHTARLARILAEPVAP